MNRYLYLKQQEDNCLAHHGIKGQKWGVRRYQNEDGSYTEEGKKRYGIMPSGRMSTKGQARYYKDLRKQAMKEGYKDAALDRRIKDAYDNTDDYNKGKKRYKERQDITKKRIIFGVGAAVTTGVVVMGVKKILNEELKDDLVSDLANSENRAYMAGKKAVSEMNLTKNSYDSYKKSEKTANEFAEEAGKQTDDYSKHIYETASNLKRQMSNVSKDMAKYHAKNAVRYTKEQEQYKNESETLRDQIDYLKKHPFSTKAKGGWKPV